MSWLWGSSKSPSESSQSGSSESSKKPPASTDPLRNLDPSLQDFLKKEQPKPYSSLPSSQRAAAKPKSDTSPAQDELVKDPAQPIVPPQSLFQDGRYAHLWKTYQPLGQVEDSMKTTKTQLTDVLQGYAYKKSQVGKAALENCAFEQIANSDCLRKGSWKDKATMCREQTRALDRCYIMQAVVFSTPCKLADKLADVESRGL